MRFVMVLIISLLIILLLPNFIEKIYSNEVMYEIYESNSVNTAYLKEPLDLSSFKGERAKLQILDRNLNEQFIEYQTSTLSNDSLFTQRIKFKNETLEIIEINNNTYFILAKIFNKCYYGSDTKIKNSINSIRHNSLNNKLYIKMKWDKEYINSSGCIKGSRIYKKYAILVLNKKINISEIVIVSHSPSTINYRNN